MKKIFAFSMMAALVLASCSPKENFAPTLQPEKPGMTIRATIAPETRTYLVEDGDVFHMLWKAGDIIRCTDDGNNTEVLYQTQDDGVAAAGFTWMPENGEFALCPDSTKFWAYWPPERGRKLPAIQKYKEHGLDVAPIRGYYERAADAAFDPNFVFKNVAGALKLNVTTTQSDVKVQKVVIRADMGLSGSYSNSVEEPTAVMSSLTAPVTLDCPNVAIGTEPTDFWISIPPYTYLKFDITLITDDGRTQTRSLKSGETLTIDRAQVHELTLAYDNLQKPAVGETATFMKARDMNSTIKGIINPDVSSYSDDDTTITKMVFVTESDAFSAVNIADATSESPIYVFWDEANTTITVSTPAKKFVMNVDSWGFFHRYKALTTIEGIEDFDTSNMESMAYFFGYTAVKDVKLPNTWDYSKVINTRYMFYGATSESIDVSAMDFSQDTSMAYMFADIATNPEIIWPDEVDCSNLTTMASMFRYSRFTQIDLSKFVNTDAVTTIRYTFAYDTALTKVIANLDLSALATGTSGIGYCFSYASEEAGLLDLSQFDVSTAPTMSYAFYRCYASTLDLSTWNCESCQFMNYMFYQCNFLGNLYLGPDFYPAASTPGATGYLTPTNFTGGTSDASSGIQIASVPGSLNIYTTPEIAEWLVYTLLRKAYWGSYTGEPLPITFYNIDNPTVEIEVTWQPA